jgi:hypothetical protein
MSLADAGAAQPSHQLINEPQDAAGGVGRALAQPGVQHLAGAGAEGEQRVVAEPVGVAVAGALLVVAVHFADGGVHPRQAARPRVRHRPLTPG